MEIALLLAFTIELDNAYLLLLVHTKCVTSLLDVLETSEFQEERYQAVRISVEYNE
jgi:hypothetical protein